MKAKKCTLMVDNFRGYTFKPIKCKSIAEAKRKGWDFSRGRGFYFMVLVGQEVVYRGYCKKY